MASPNNESPNPRSKSPVTEYIHHFFFIYLSFNFSPKHILIINGLKPTKMNAVFDKSTVLFSLE